MWGRVRKRAEGFAILEALRRLWIPLFILVVMGVGALTVARLHGIFGSEKRPSYADTKLDKSRPFHPTQLSYEVFGLNVVKAGRFLDAVKMKHGFVITL